MHIYFDTEFTKFRDGKLLSLGCVTDDDLSFYVEIDEPARRAEASDFCKAVVLPQFGLHPAAAVRSEREAGERLGDWLASLHRAPVLCYDFNLDWHFLQEVLRLSPRWPALARQIRPLDIARVARAETCLAAQESYFEHRRNPGQHHALVDAYALRERWREHLRIGGATGDASREAPPR